MKGLLLTLLMMVVSVGADGSKDETSSSVLIVYDSREVSLFFVHSYIRFLFLKCSLVCTESYICPGKFDCKWNTNQWRIGYVKTNKHTRTHTQTYTRIHTSRCKIVPSRK
jgi:hypothetical protein